MTRDLSDNELTKAAIASFAQSPSPRFKQIAESLVAHLHGFLTDVELTEDEWFAAIDFLTRCGQITDDRRQEFILLSDVLGVSMRVIDINHRAPSVATESTVFGPFFVAGSPRFDNGDDISAGAPGQPCHISGRVLSTDGEPVTGARIEVWQADDAGFYDVQYGGDEVRGRGHLFARADGSFDFWTVRPEAYPIPDDGPVGDLLRAGGRGPMRPAHVHFMIEARGHARLITHVFAAGDKHLGSDAVFGVKDPLVAEFVRHEPAQRLGVASFFSRGTQWNTTSCWPATTAGRTAHQSCRRPARRRPERRRPTSVRAPSCAVNSGRCRSSSG